MNPGTRFTGKWSGLAVEVVKQLGAGANGEVYLVKTPLGKAALKVCPSSGDAAMEWSMLTSVVPAGQSPNPLFPKPMVLDDGPSEAPFFYVMEWIVGNPLTDIYQAKDWPKTHEAAVQTLAALSRLHRTGHAFCDLKPDNILVSQSSTGLCVRFVDVGGVTPIGRSVRQFTPQSDRAYFSLGSRRAEASYDLAAFVLGLIMTWNQADMKKLAGMSPEMRRKWVDGAIRDFPVAQAGRLFNKLILGDITDASMALAEWRKVPAAAPRVTAASTTRSHRRKRRRARVASTKRQQSGKQRRARTAKKVHDWTEWVMWISICSAATVTLAAWVDFFGR